MPNVLMSDCKIKNAENEKSQEGEKVWLYIISERR